MSIANLATEVHQSRFGFHPCSKEIDKKLRFLNGLYQKSLRQAGAWKRWEGKAPHNRILRKKIRDDQGRVCGREIVLQDNVPVMIPEPSVKSVFLKTGVRKWYVDYYGKWISGGYERPCVNIDSHYIPEAARLARIPVSDPDKVVPLPLTIQQIELLYAQATA